MHVHIEPEQQFVIDNCFQSDGDFPGTADGSMYHCDHKNVSHFLQTISVYHFDRKNPWPEGVPDFGKRAHFYASQARR